MSESTEEYRSTYARIRHYLDKEEYDPKDFLDEISRNIEKFEKGEMPQEQATSFVNTYLPNFIKTLLERKYYHLNYQAQIGANEFLKKTLLFCIKYLKPENHGLIDILIKIFTEEKTYYDNRYTLRSHEIELVMREMWNKEHEERVGDPETLEITPRFAIVQNCCSLNCFFTYNLNFFGIHGGFNKVLSYITSDPHPPIDHMHIFLVWFLNLREFLDHDVWKKHAKLFYKATIKAVMSLNDEEFRSAPKQDIQTLVSHLETLLEKLYTESKIGRILENFELDLSMKCLKGINLEKRIHGITEISLKISQAKHKDEDDKRLSKGGYIYKSDYHDTARWLTTQRLLQWIDNHNLFELIFGPSSHPQLVKRSADIIRFLYSNSRFSRDHIDLIWNSASSKHEAEREALMTLIQDIVPCLSAQDLHYFFMKLYLLPYAEIDSQVLSLIKSFVRQMSNLRAGSRHKSIRYGETVLEISPWAHDNDQTRHINVPMAKEEYREIEEQAKAVEGEVIALGPPENDSYRDQMQIANEEDAISTAPEDQDSEGFETSQALDFLWNLCQEEALDAGISKTISSQTLKILQDLLTNYYRSDRLKFMIRCIENIKKNSNVLSSCQLLEHILNSYPSTRISNSVTESRNHMIKWLEKEQHLLSEIFNSFIAFKRNALEQAQTLLSEGGEKPEEDRTDDAYSTCSSGEEEDESRKKKYEAIFKQIQVSKDMDVNYIEEIKMRLEFLKFLYSNSSESIHPKHAQLLWDTLVINSATESEHEEYFSWLVKTLTNWHGDYAAFDDDIIHLIFTDMLLKLDPRFYSSGAYKCFETVFININKQHGLLYKYDFDEEIDVKDITLLGIQALWELILQARIESVFKDASKLLNHLYKGLRKCTPDIQEDFLRNCMQHIKMGAEAIHELQDVDSLNRVSRALSLLVDFIEDFEGRNFNKAADNGFPIEIVVDNKIDGAMPPKIFNVTLYSEMPIGDAKKLIASKLNPPMPVSSLQIINMGKILDARKDAKTVSELGIIEKARFLVFEIRKDFDTYEYESGMPAPDEQFVVRPEDLESLKLLFEGAEDDLLKLALEKVCGSINDAVDLLLDEESKMKLQKQLNEAAKVAVKPKVAETYRLSNILSNTNEYFNLLFELFELGNSAINSQIWILLNKIPVNQEMYEGIKTLKVHIETAEADWNSLLDKSCMYKLLYSLQIVNSFILLPEDSTQTHEEIEERQSWRAKFLDLGGFHHLYSILMNSQQFQMSSEQYKSNAKCVGFLLNVVKLFIQAALLSEPCEDLQNIFSPEKLKKSNSQGKDSNILEEELPSLIRKMSGGAAERMIEEIDFNGLISKLIELISENIQLSHENEAVLLIESALDLLLPIVIYKPNLLCDLYEKESFKQLIIASLLVTENSSIRETMKNTLSTISETIKNPPNGIEPPKEFLLKILLEKIPKDSTSICDEFFDLLTIIIELCNFTDPSLMSDSIELIFNREMIEDRTLGNQDKVLTGFMKIIKTLLNLSPDYKEQLTELLEYTYKCLFEIPEHAAGKSSNPPPKCKHVNTRKAAFALLLELSSGCSQNATVLLKKLYENHSDNKQSGSFDSDISTRAACGYVGLRNLGSTCYMNSLLQQIYMMPELRKGILDTKIVINEEMDSLDDNLIYQLQLILANLSESEKQFYEPRGFCNAFKGYDGEPINVRIQQDADEFFNLLCDKLEEEMKPTRQAKLLRNHMGGSLVHEIESSEPDFPYKSERDEQFFRISLDIKNKKNLSEALDLYIKEDKLEGDNKYFCDLYNQKINAKKRCLINTLANTVIIQLKRFEFDLTRMARVKVNDYCEFPIHLNLKPWTKDGINGNSEKPDSYYQYELVGVIVHSGGADAGHYYSFIKDRQGEKWFRFDDRVVESFNIENLKEECYGGESTYSWGSSSQYYSKTKNAYMLVYERLSPIVIEEDAEIIGESSEVSKTDEIFQKIWIENMEFFRDLLFFDTSYFEMVKTFVQNFEFDPVSEISPAMSDCEISKEKRKMTEFILKDKKRLQMTPNMISHEPDFRDIYMETRSELLYESIQESDDYGLKLIKLGTLFAYEMLIRAKNLEAFKNWVEILSRLYRNHAPACLWFIKYLSSHKDIIIEVLFYCRDTQVRYYFADLLANILAYSCEIEKELLFDYEDVINLKSLPIYSYHLSRNEEDLFEKLPKSVSVRFIDLYLTELMGEARKNWRRFDEFFMVFKKFVAFGQLQCKIAIERTAIRYMLKFFMNGAMPFPDKHFMGDQATDPDLSIVLEILSLLICASVTQSMIDSSSYPPAMLDKSSDIIMDSITEIDFQDYRVYGTLLRNIKNDVVTKITLHLAWCNMESSISFTDGIFNMIMSYKATFNEVSPYLKILAEILKLEDGHIQERTERFLSAQLISGSIVAMRSTFLEIVYKYKEIHTMFAVLVVLWWSDMMNLDPIKEVAIRHASKFRWMVAFIHQLNFRHLPHSIIMDYEGKMRNVIDELKKSLPKFDIEISSDSDEDSQEIEFSNDYGFNNNSQPAENADSEPKEEEHRDEDSTSSDEELTNIRL
ncbi:unnamed protein product [Blepharisma stoltei]|uniref:ubiquitinyl hydrolase 1 n=1 Tax=Blepharisma stoltei TaxID=1481888 RepID=A0AAU9K5L5_9CILI|nr:unnamed protein product [Blepharisma stoltei]